MHALALDSCKECNNICYKTPEEATVRRVVSVPLFVNEVWSGDERLTRPFMNTLAG